MKLISWNVNGLRAVMGKNFMEFFNEIDADVFCLQETKLQAGQIEMDLPGYYQYWNYAERKGYSGTAIFTKHTPLSVVNHVGPAGGAASAEAGRGLSDRPLHSFGSERNKERQDIVLCTYMREPPEKPAPVHCNPRRPPQVVAASCCMEERSSLGDVRRGSSTRSSGSRTKAHATRNNKISFLVLTCASNLKANAQER